MRVIVNKGMLCFVFQSVSIGAVIARACVYTCTPRTVSCDRIPDPHYASEVDSRLGTEEPHGSLGGALDAKPCRHTLFQGAAERALRFGGSFCTARADAAERASV